MARENLILVHSYPTNSILLSGLVEYLDDFFDVHLVDLPGFTKAVPPLLEITWAGYTRFFESKVAELDLESFLVGGISFGFAVVNGVKYSDRCKGILAIMPYIGPESLRMSLLKKALYTLFIKGVCFFRLYRPVWESRLLKTYLPKLRHYPPGAIDVMLEQVDARTFFEVGNLLLSEGDEYSFQKVPYVLVANKDDRSVNFEYIHGLMSDKVDRLLTVNTVMDHYPRTTTKEYFGEQFPEEKVREIMGFLSLE